MGRPTKYKPEFCGQIHDMVLAARNGVTDKYIANFFQINELTVNRWKKKYPEFSKSLNLSKEDLNNDVKRSLWERAIGYSCNEVKCFVINGEIKTKTIIKHYPPDPTSMIFWLKNREREHWRDVQEVINKTEPNDISDLEIARTVAFLLTNATQSNDPPIKEIN